MIIGITGTIGAGKGTVAAYLKEKGFKDFSLSEFLAAEAIRRGLEPTRVNRRIIGNEYRHLGSTKLVEAVFRHASADIERGVDVIIEPEHTRAEVEYLQRKGGVVIAVEASLDVRYARIQSRGDMKDQVSFEEFVEEQDRQMASPDPDENNLKDAIRAADIRIENNGSLYELYGKIDGILEKIL